MLKHQNVADSTISFFSSL